MLKFVNIDQQNPPKRSIDKRKTDFKEIYDEYINMDHRQSSHSTYSYAPSRRISYDPLILLAILMFICVCLSISGLSCASLGAIGTYLFMNNARKTPKIERVNYESV